MARRTRTLTVFGEDLDSLLARAGGPTLRDYADQCGVSYKYLSQLRTRTGRRPGRLYADLLKPFVRLGLVDLAEAHRLSARHREKPLSFGESKELFPEVPEQELLHRIKRALESRAEEQTPSHLATVENVAEGGEARAHDLLLRHAFVGRQRELSELRSAFDNAAAGKGSVLMLGGEPGIGKTALCGQLGSYVASRGGMTLIGHCYEQASLSLPYMAFVEALRSHVISREAAELTHELGSGAADIARIIPEIRSVLGVQVRSGGDPVEEKHRLLQAIAGFLARVAEIKPLLLVIEDLHGADVGTLEILRHIARNSEHERVMVVGTYRSTEIDRTHRLSGTLAELRRLPHFGRLLLHGLNIDEVARMLSSIVGRDAPADLATAVHRRTEGNPLFVEEVAHYLVEGGLIDSDAESMGPALGRTIELTIPAGLRDVIGKRLSGLSNNCNSILSVAAVIGREFRLDILEVASGTPQDTVLEALEEATKATVIEEHFQIGDPRYRFAHAFFRQALYEDLIAPKRLMVHQRVGRALETLHKKDLRAQAAELAEHFSQSTDPTDLRKAVGYAEAAARGSAEAYAYGDAVRFYELALRIQRILNQDNKAKICDLLLDLCDTLLEVPETERIYESVAPEAFLLADTLGDKSRAVRACSAALFALWSEQGSRTYTTPRWAQWAARVDRIASPGTIEGVMSDWALGMIRSVQGDLRSAQRLRARSYKQACQLDEPLILSLAGIARLVSLSAPQHIAERRRVADELWTRLRPVLTVRTAYHLLAYVGDAFLSAGERGRAEEVFFALREIAARSGNTRIGFDSASMDLILSVMDGHLEESMRTAETILAQSLEAGIPSSGDYAAIGLVRARTYAGLPVQPVLHRIPPMLAQAAEVIGLAHSGQMGEAREALENLLSFRLKQGDEAYAYYDVSILEASVLTGHTRAANFAVDRFSGKGVATSGLYWPTCISRHLGAATAMLGRYDEARHHYQEAIRVCAEMRFRPELALTRLQLAELLLERYPGEENHALEHLDFAIGEFREMKMKPSLERALQCRTRWGVDSGA